MRPPSPRITRNRVTIQPTVFTKDADRGRVPTPSGIRRKSTWCECIPHRRKTSPTTCERKASPT